MPVLQTAVLLTFAAAQFMSVYGFAAAAGNTSTRILPVVWTVECCDIWEALGTFTIEKTGSYLSRSACQQQSDCSQLKLVTNFVEQTRALLGPDAISTGPLKQIHFNLSTVSTQNMLQTLALSYVGRVISVNDLESDNQISLLYDVQYDTLSIERPTCQYSKRIYSGMVLASVCLLIFFIVMQIIEKNQSEQKLQTAKGMESIKSTKEAESHADMALKSKSAMLLRCRANPLLQVVLK